MVTAASACETEKQDGESRKLMLMLTLVLLMLLMLLSIQLNFCTDLTSSSVFEGIPRNTSVEGWLDVHVTTQWHVISRPKVLSCAKVQ